MTRLARFIRTLFGKLFRKPLIDIEADYAPEAEASPHCTSIMTMHDYHDHSLGG